MKLFCSLFVCLFIFSKPLLANNPYGLMMMTGGDADTAGMLHNYRLAHQMIGDWGYVRIGAEVEPSSIPQLVTTLIACRALKLTPVVTAFKLPRKFYTDENPEIARRDPDGSLATFTNAYEDWLREVYRHGVTIPYFEYGNEVNGGFFGGSSKDYGEACVAASIGFKRVDPKLSFGTAGMAGCALDFYEKLLTDLPDLINHVDHWGFHPYGVNHPPGYTQYFDDYGLECNRFLAPLLEKHGVKNPVLIATETNYELGNQRDRRFPKITEELRAKYLVDAYKNWWEKDPHVKAIMLFILQDVRWQAWNGWDLVREDYSLTPAYTAIAALEKPVGSDFLPSGNAGIKGRIIESSTGQPLPDTLVWVTMPAGRHYAAVSDLTGRFLIQNIPPGGYQVHSERKGFANPQISTIDLQAGKLPEIEILHQATSLGAPIEGKGPVAQGWTASSDNSVYSVVQTANGTAQSITGDGRENTIWFVTGYESVLPGRTYGMSASVDVSNIPTNQRKSVKIRLSLTDSYNRVMASAECSAIDSSEKQTLTAYITGTPKARRLRAEIVSSAAKGRVLARDVRIHEAQWLSQAPGVQGKGAVSGAVLKSGTAGEEGYYLQQATVWLNPSGRFAVTDSLGRFEFKGVPAGNYQLMAVHPDAKSALEIIEVTDNKVSRDLVLGQKPAPPQIVNGDFESLPSHPTWFADWSKFGTTEGIVPNGWHKGLPEHPEGFKAHSGNGFYGAVAGSNIKDGGLFQTIEVEPDALYEVSVWHYTWQTGDGKRGDVANRLGVDPFGGNDPASAYVLWTPYTVSHLKWSPLSIKVRPVSNRMTVYLNHLQVHGLTFNANLFDDVVVKKIGSPVSGPTASID